MASEPVPSVPAPMVPAPAEPDRFGQPQPKVSGVDWFRRMPNGGGTVYRRP
ncbi:hypothetical protein ACVDFE_40550 [Lentzea chajnantorensis]